MSLPATRQEFKDYCLRKLGAPTLKVHLTEQQIDDRVDEALQYFWDYHYDGSIIQYYKHAITDTDKTNKYIEIPENIIGVVDIFSINNLSVSSNDLFNVNYQMAMNFMHNMNSFTLVPYYMARQHLNVFDEVLVGQQPIRYNRHMNRLYIDMNWDRLNTGQYLIVRAHQVIDPADWPNVWKDRWLLEFTTQLIKRQHGEMLSKYSGVQLPGGVTLNGERIIAEAEEALESLRKQALMLNPVRDVIM